MNLKNIMLSKSSKTQTDCESMFIFHDFTYRIFKSRQKLISGDRNQNYGCPCVGGRRFTDEEHNELSGVMKMFYIFIRI